jgi:UDPglucose 6-dehydrogenase
MREAPSLTLIADLLEAGAEVRAYDPVAGDQAGKILSGKKNIDIKSSAKEALQGCDALAIVTEWAEFRAPDFALLKKTLKTPAIFDGRNLYDPAMMKSLGFEYFPIGRKA